MLTCEVTPAALAIVERGLRNVLVHMGILPKRMRLKGPEATRIVEVGGADYFIYAPEGGVFEPLVALGDMVVAGQPAARIHFHHTPWREPETVPFKRGGLVLCKRVPARCERGDCLFHLATDVAG